jgi:hypothetical protein
MKHTYVRPGTRYMSCSVHSYFGSGCGSVRLTLRDGARRVGEPREMCSNGFLSWNKVLVELPAGSSAVVDEWYHPGGERVTEYVADLDRWRTQRREHLRQLLAHRRQEADFRRLRMARRDEIERRLRAAITSVLYSCRAVAEARASGRSGGRARRRSSKLLASASDQRRLAAALASTWIVEVMCGCNQARDVGYGLDSRTVRWELRDRPRRGLPRGCEIAADWLPPVQP